MTGPAPMVALVEQYLAHRRTLGFALRIEGGQLVSFARFADAIGHRGPLTLDLIVRWATRPSRRPRRFPARRLDVVRPFARYRAGLDLATEVPPRGLLGPARRRPDHHIFTAVELAALVAEARCLAPATGLRPTTFATLFGLLAATGLRVAEALRLTRDDVDLATGILTIRATKFRKSRLVPLHATTTVALRAYADDRDLAVPRPASPRFFTTATGTELPYPTVRGVFRRLCATLGWEARVPRPRIHDMRHAFACRRLQQWYVEGVEVAPRVAALATYLGHAKITDTYWYLTGTPELLALAATRFAAFAADTTGGPR
ncbi:MAG: tyrosine-type recombinase/integrase [Gemmatimonadales bacterium]